MRDIDYYEWNRISIECNNVSGFDIDEINLLTYESSNFIENIISQYDNKIDVNNNIIINPTEDVNNIAIRTDSYVYNYKNDGEESNIFKHIIEGNDDDVIGFFVNFDDDYFVDNYNIYSTSYSNLYSNRVYKNYSRLSKIPIYELLGSIYTTDVGILIGDNLICSTSDILLFSTKDDLHLNASNMILDVYDLKTNTLNESNDRNINLITLDIDIYGSKLNFNNTLEVLNDKVIIKKIGDDEVSLSYIDNPEYNSSDTNPKPKYVLVGKKI